MSVDPRSLSKWLKRLGLPALLIGFILLFRTYWFMTVPVGMDTMPEIYPPGTTCVVEYDPSQLIGGKSVIFLEVEAGAQPILVRVRKVENGRVFPSVDNPRSRYAGYARQSYLIEQVRALVLSGVTPDQQAGIPPSK